MGCERRFCPDCGEEFIHRDHRKIDESSSALGQIIHREGPSKLTIVDIDIVSLKWLESKKILFRLIEQKQPNHGLKPGQKAILKIFDNMISHCIICEATRDLQLDDRSGAYLMSGLIEADDNSPMKEPIFKEPQKIKKLDNRVEEQFEDHESFFKFLDPQDPERKGKISRIRYLKPEFFQMKTYR
jgi:hypothetical protein